MQNTNAVIAPVALVIGNPDIDPVDAACDALADGAKAAELSTGELIRAFAAALEMRFNIQNDDGSVVKWFNLVGKEKKGLKEKRARFVAAMVARGFTKDGIKPSATVDTYWQRVKEASGYVPRGRVSGSKTVDDQTVAELKTIINRILKAEEDGQEPEASQHKRALIEVFEALGGDAKDLG